MPGSLTHLRVFIASPGGLEEERKAFRDVVRKYNRDEAIPRGVYFEPVGWEDTLSSVGRPQRLINEDVEVADYFLLILHNRWGSDPGGSSEYTSGTEEEYRVARACHEDDAAPMCDLAMLFKAVAPDQLNDPGPQLQKVLDFQEKVEEERRHFYQRFDTTEHFKDLLLSYLGAWMRQQQEGTRPQPPQPQSDEVPDDTSEEDIESQNEQTSEAWKLADEGRLTEAEVLFSHAVVERRDPGVLLSYGRFLQRQGRVDQARVYVDKAVEAAKDHGDQEALARAIRRLGLLSQAHGDLAEAEEMHRKALKINRDLGRREGMANAYGNLGLVLWRRGDLEEAEEMHRKSLKIDGELGRREGMANAYGNLALLSQARGDLDEAEEMHRRSLKINKHLGRREYIANAYGNLGRVFYERGNLDEAERMHRKSLKIDEELGRREGIANAHFNIGNVLQARKDSNKAEEMYRKALEIDETLGRHEGMAANYTELGNVFKVRKDFDRAEEMYRQALKLAKQIGNTSLVERIVSLLNALGGSDGPAPQKGPSGK